MPEPQIEPTRPQMPREKSATPTPTIAQADSTLNTSFIEQDRKPAITVAHRVQRERSQGTERSEGPSLLRSAAQRGSAGLQALRGLNFGLTTFLSVMNFSAGKPVLGAMWGACAVLWGVLTFGKPANRSQ